MLSNLPMISFEELFHVGILDRSMKRRNSYEGLGLSVSTEPEAWKEIAFLYGLPVYKATKEENQFLDYYKLTDTHKKFINQWGVSNEYITPANLFRVGYYDNYFKAEIYSDYLYEEEAEFVANLNSAEIEIVEGYLSTQKLQQSSNGDAVPLMIRDLIIIQYIEDVLGIDGVWWNDRLDVYQLSAPRGVIIPNKILGWDFKLKLETSIY